MSGKEKNLAFRLFSAVLILPPFASALTCGLAFGALFLVGQRYSAEQIVAAAAIQTLFWIVVLTVWAIGVWRR